MRRSAATLIALELFWRLGVSLTLIHITLGVFYEAGHFVVCGRADRGDNPPQGGRHHLMTFHPKALANACQVREANLWGQRLQLIIKNSEDA